MYESTDEWTEHLDELARSIARIVAAREGRLCGLTLAVPEPLVGVALDQRLQERLSYIGVDFVDIRTVPASAGRMRLVSTEFEPW